MLKIRLDPAMETQLAVDLFSVFRRESFAQGHKLGLPGVALALTGRGGDYVGCKGEGRGCGWGYE